MLTTPNHPEYPAAHSSTAASLGESLRQYYGTDKVTYTFDSKVMGTSRTYPTTDQLTEESRAALSACAPASAPPGLTTSQLTSVSTYHMLAGQVLFTTIPFGKPVATLDTKTLAGATVPASAQLANRF